MDSDAWFACYPSDLTSATDHLCNHDFGAYVHALCWYYRNGPLPNDDEKMRTLMRVDKADWMRTKGNIMGFFSLNGDGRWHQKRCDEVISERNEAISKRRAQTAAARAANPKHQFVTNPVTNPDTTSVTAVQSQSQSQVQGGAPKVTAESIRNEKELDRVEKRLAYVKQQGTTTALGTTYTAPQRAEIHALKDRREQLKKALGFIA